MQDFSDLGFKPIAQKSQGFEDLGFKPIESKSTSMKDMAAAPQKGFMGAVDKFNQAIEGTGLPNFATGFMQGGQNALANTLNFISQMTGNKDTQGNPVQFPLANYGRSGAAHGLGDIVGAGSTYFMPGGVAKALPQMGRAGAAVDSIVSSLPRLSEGLVSAKNALSTIPGAQKAAAAIGSPIGQGAIGGGLFGAAQMPENRTLGAGLGAGGSVLLDAALPAAKAGINALTRPRATEGEVNSVLNALPAELRNEMPIGELVQSAPLQSIQKNVIENIPFSGMSKPYENLNEYVVKEGKGIYEGLLAGRDTKNIPQEIYGAIKKNYKSVNKSVDKAYKNFRTIADETNIPFSPVNTTKAIDDEISRVSQILEKHPSRKDEYTPVLSALGDYKKTLNYKGQADVITGKQETKPLVNNFKEAEELRRDINSGYEDAFASHNDKLLGSLKRIKSSFNKDLTDSAQSNTEVAAALKTADNLYKRKVQFESEIKPGGSESPSEFYKQFYAEKKGKPVNLDNFLSHYVRTGKNKDYADTLQNLVNLLPDKSSRDLLAANYLKDSIDANGRLNPGKLISDYSKLGDRQRDILMPELKEKFGNLEKISKAYPETFGIEYNPKTGHQAAKLLPYGGSAGLAAVGSGMGGPVGAAIGALSLPGLGYLGRKALTSPTLRNALMQKEMSMSPETRNALNSLYLGSISQTGGQ